MQREHRAFKMWLFLGILALVGPRAALTGGLPAEGVPADQLLVLNGGGAIPGLGDFVSSFRNLTGDSPLDTEYNFYIEVPPGQSTLKIEIFDADVYLGRAIDFAAGRDEDRTSSINTKAKYELFDPSGKRVPARFNYADDEVPVAGDGVWLVFYDSSTAGISGGETFLDEFNADGTYDRNDGSSHFESSWIESNDLGGAGPGVGDIRVQGGELRISNDSDEFPLTNQPWVMRELDLGDFEAAQLSFDFRTLSGVDRIGASVGNIGDSIVVEISARDESYEILEEFAGLEGVNEGSRSYDISNYLSGRTKIRFRVTNRYSGSNESFIVDNFLVRGVDSLDGSNPLNGHWRLAVDMSGDVNGHVAGMSNDTRQDDINALAIRAHDGDASALGQEFNIYAHSFLSVGVNNEVLARDYSLYPYVTSGCFFHTYNWDWDADQASSTINSPPYGTMDFRSRRGEEPRFFIENFSGNNDWRRSYVDVSNSFDAFDGYGIWSMDVRIEDFGNNNLATLYLAAHDAAPEPPTGNPETNTLRIYLPTDASTAPAKPYLSQSAYYWGAPGTVGPNPLVVAATTRLAVVVEMVNPAGSIGDIIFSPTHLVQVSLPGGEVAFGAIERVSHGSVEGQPSPGSTEVASLSWNPGVLSPGTTATLVYTVDVTLQSPIQVDLTGAAGTGGGTRAVFIDETGDMANSRSIFEFGELCQLGADPFQAFRELGLIVDVSSDAETVPESGETVTMTVRVEAPGSALPPFQLTGLSSDSLGDLHGMGSCVLPQILTPGAFYECTLPVLVEGLPGSWTDMVTVESDFGLGGSGEIVVPILDVEPSLVVEVSADPTDVPVEDREVTYSVSLRNSSVATDPVDVTGLSDSFVGADLGPGCEVPSSLEPGAIFACEFTANVPGELGEIVVNTVTATIEDDEGNTVMETGDAAVTIVEGGILTVSVTNGVDLVAAGSTVTYFLTAGNLGPIDATDVTLEANFPESLTGCRWRSRSTGGAYGQEPGLGSALEQTLALPAGGTVHYVISCAVPSLAVGPFRFDAAVSRAGGDVVVAEAMDEDPLVERANISTLILTHPGRMLDQLETTALELGTLAARLDEFARHTNVDGLVFDVGHHGELAELYATWDEDMGDGSSDPQTANRVIFGCDDIFLCGSESSGVHDLMRSMLSIYPEVEHLMLVGDDRIFPMARIPDLTFYPSERDYTPLGNFTPDLSHTRTSVGQALARNRYLSDDPISRRQRVLAIELEFPYLLLRPELAVGRLVETPAEILGSLDVFLQQDGRVELGGVSPDHRVLVTGYDFLVDSALRIRRHWNRAFGLPDDSEASTPVNGRLISRDWGFDDPDQRKDALLDNWTGGGVSSYRLMCFNGHADHAKEGIPGENVSDIRGLDAGEIAALDPELAGRGSLIYAVGCHGGLPVPGSETMDADHSLDLPQTFLGQGVLGYLANSGFGWGLRHAIGFSEKLMVLFTEELARPGTVTLGQAMVLAKERYYLEDAFFSLTDIKTSLQWTLFGFPMVKIVTGIPESIEPVTETDPATDSACQGQPDHLDCKLEINFMSEHGSFVKYQADGEEVPPSVEGCPSTEGCYYALNDLTTTEEGWPIEPVVVEDSRRAGTSQHGVLWIGGRYRQESGWRPVLAQPESSGGPVDVPGSLPQTTFIRPKGRASGGGLDGSPDCSPTDTELNTLVFVPAELIYDDQLEPTIHRLHLEVGLETFYFNNDDGLGNCDQLGPDIGDGPHHTVAGDWIRFSVAATDDYQPGEEKEGVWRVVVVWDDESESRWRPVELYYDAASGHWLGEVRRPLGQDRFVYFLQAVDLRGNVSWVNFEPSEDEPPRSGIGGLSDIGEPGLPKPIEADFPPFLFWDDFETGDTSRWSGGS